MYDGIKQAIGPMHSRIAPQKSVTGDAMKDKSNQVECRVEHYSEHYSRMNVVSQEALCAMGNLPTFDQLDSEPTLEEINHAFLQ